MMVRAYLDWSRTAGAAERAEAAAMLAEVLLGAELGPEDRRDAEAALVMASEDPSPLVRQAIAVVLAGSEFAPRTVISLLARDQAGIAAVVVANSPVLTDAEVAELAVFAAGPVLEAACARPYVSEELAEALATAADARAAMILLDNPGAEVPLNVLRSLAEQHGGDAAFRELLLARDDIPADLRFTLAEAAARQLAAFAVGRGWLGEARSGRMQVEAVDAAAITVATDADEAELSALADRLRQGGRLTPQLLLRMVLCGEIRLFSAALADLAEVDQRRALGFVQGRGGVGFAALCRKAGLPAAMTPAFAAAAAAWQALGGTVDQAGRGLWRTMIEMVLSSVALIEGPEMGRVRTLLLAYHAEAIRDEARLRIADLLADGPAVAEVAEPALMEPQADDLEAALTEALAVEFRAAA